jgi:hypothetical protein
MANPNYQLVVNAAKLVKPILDELVFVGGCATGLLITDRAAADVRGYMENTQFTEELKALGFREDTREGTLIICRAHSGGRLACDSCCVWSQGADKLVTRTQI